MRGIGYHSRASAPNDIGVARALIAAALLGACSEGAPADRGGATHRISDLSFHEVFVAGDTLDLEEIDGVMTVDPIVTLSSTSIWVADSQDAQVRQYSRTGQIANAFGRRGQGPGEMSRPTEVLPLSRELVLVLDSFRSPNLSIWDLSDGEGAFVGYVRQDSVLLYKSARILEDGRVLLASSHTRVTDPGHLPMGLLIGTIDTRPTPTGEFASSFRTLDITTAIPAELIPAYQIGGWPIIDVRGHTLAVASTLQDSIRVHDFNTGTTVAIQLPTTYFQTVNAPPLEARNEPGLFQDWVESFSQVEKLFFVGDDLLIVQFLDIVDRGPEYHLLGMSLDGSLRFQVRNAPRMLAWDRKSEQLLGYRAVDGYPNELAWYSIRSPQSPNARRP